jgi:hypothetical protein
MEWDLLVSPHDSNDLIRAIEDMTQQLEIGQNWA